jgi:hypothetical protein
MIYVKVKGIQPTAVATCLFKAKFCYAYRRGENLSAIQQKVASSHLMIEKEEQGY